MKNFDELQNINQRNMPKQAKKQTNWKRKPTPIKEDNDLNEISRIVPSFIAKNFDFWQLLPRPKVKVVDWAAYVVRIKIKINCLKTEFTV